jgi:Transmembrane protein 131-like N-terminal
MYNLFLLSFSLCFFPLFFSVKGSDGLTSQIEIIPSSNELKLASSSTCFGFLASCPDSTSLCFPSVKPDLSVRSSQQHETETGNTNPQQSVSFSLANGGLVTCSSLEPMSTDGVHGRSFGGYDTVLCQSPLIPDDWMKASNGVTIDWEEGVKEAEMGQLNRSPSSPLMEITPSLLDWGISSLYVASVSTLTLTNIHQDSVLDVYEPYCTDPQFYPYNFEELSIEPGENASISFVFLPRNLGFSSAQIVLQTSFGGFVLQAKGVANESAYNIEPLVGINLHVNDVLTKALSIHNPFEESIYVEEVVVWMSALESVSQSNHAVCQLSMSATSSSEVEWFSMGNDWYGLPRVDFRPISSWEILPKDGDGIVELRLQADSQGEVFGAICMKLRTGITQRVTTVVVPLEVQIHEHDNLDHVAFMGLGSISASFKSHLACDGSGLIFTLYLKNDGWGSLSIVNIFEEKEGEKMYEIRYVKHLVLFPTSTTAVALISRKLRNSEISGVDLQCNVVVETNHSSNAFLRIPCQDLACTSSSNVVSDLGSVSEGLQEKAMNAEGRSFVGVLEDSTEKVLRLLNS